MLQQAIEAFVQEAGEILAGLENSILALEDGTDPALVDEIFRGLHTVKGSGGMFGYTCLSRFTHHFESAFDLVRSGQLRVDPPLIDLCLAARDVMCEFIALGGDGPVSEDLLASERIANMIAALSALTAAAPDAQAVKPLVEEEALPEPESTERSYSIEFRPDANALRNGMRPDLLMAELGELGTTAIHYDTTAIPRLDELDPTEALLGWQVTLRTQSSRAAIEEVFIFADDADLVIAETAPAPVAAEAEAALPVAPVPAARLARADAPAAPGPTPRKEAKSDSIRVTSSRLDDMMDSLGELVIAQARLDAVAQRFDDPALESVVEEMARLVIGLRDATLSIRMLPIENVFAKFKRVVRDLAAELGKEVHLVTEGGETEVDKNVIDRIGDPLVHMIRNSIDHGLETADEREAAGKPRTGTVRLSARQEGGEILVSIEDNGRGLNTEAIRNRAIERGLIAADAVHSERELHHLIFEPGFSTAAVVSAVSGRGVGMDAVKTTIDALGGTIDVLSRNGRGSRITLRLPVTMAIIDGLRVKLGPQVYVIPLSSVEECVELGDNAGARRSGRSLLEIRNEMVPFLELEKLFCQPGDPQARRRVVVVRVDGTRVGLVVDDILGQGQTVIKSLSSFHSGLPGLGGATILGDGRVALIVDVATLIRSAEVPRAETVRRVAA
ncbi:MAG: chemotaxis protein CheA [Rhodobacteraceae bacterium]|nr:chemotaxis protein CheA [Paracoccaceae bacterium]